MFLFFNSISFVKILLRPPQNSWLQWKTQNTYILDIINQQYACSYNYLY